MITGMDRIAAAAAGRRSDRIPVLAVMLDQGARELGVGLRAYYADPALVAEGQLRLRERYGYDNLWSLFYVGKEAEFFGCRDILFAEDGPPNVAEYVLRDADDIRRLEVPDVARHPAFQPMAECIARLRERAGGRYPICAYVTSAMSLPGMLLGMDKWMELLLWGPEDLRDLLLAKCVAAFASHVRACRAAGTDILIYSNSFASTDFLPPHLFRSLALPWMERELAEVGTQDMVYYCGGARLGATIDIAIERLGFGTFYLSPLEDVAEGKRIVAGRGLTCGVIEDIRLARLTPAEVEAEVKRIIDAGKPGGRFAFGTMAMPLAIPEANIRTLFEAACRFGRWEDGGA
jgi:uroporphyrinogen decarboxylase